MNIRKSLDIPSFGKFGRAEMPFYDRSDYRYFYFNQTRMNQFEKTIENLYSQKKHTIFVGGSGLGKTSLANRLIFALADSPIHRTFSISANYYIRKREFWKNLADFLYLPSKSAAEFNRDICYDYLSRNSNDKCLVLIIDNAGRLNDELINIINELEALRKGEQAKVQIVFFQNGHDSIQSYSFVPQHFDLEPFNLTDVRKMIEYRLFISGSPQIFTESAIEIIFEMTGGNPRKIVNWCRASLEYISITGKLYVDECDVEGSKRIISLLKMNDENKETWYKNLESSFSYQD